MMWQAKKKFLSLLRENTHTHTHTHKEFLLFVRGKSLLRENTHTLSQTQGLLKSVSLLRDLGPTLDIMRLKAIIKNWAFFMPIY